MSIKDEVSDIPDQVLPSYFDYPVSSKSCPYLLFLIEKSKQDIYTN